MPQKSTTFADPLFKDAGKLIREQCARFAAAVSANDYAEAAAALLSVSETSLLLSSVLAETAMARGEYLPPKVAARAYREAQSV